MKEKRFNTARQSRNQKAGKPILAGISAEDNVFARRATNLTISSTEKNFAAKSERQEILQELLAGFGEDGFGMELHAFDFVAAVTEGHDDAVVGLGGDH